MKTYDTPEVACPYCGYTLQAASATPMNPDAVPEKDDLTVCFGCSAVLLFEEDLAIRKPTADELTEIARDQQSLLIVGTMRLFQQKNQDVDDARASAG